MPALLSPPVPPRDTSHWARLDDEQLVVLAGEPSGAPAQDELLRRCSALTARLVYRLAARSGLQEADRMDAEQEAVFWTLEAMRHYRPGSPARTSGCRFRTFLYRVVTVRFIDYFRRQRHRERRIGLAARLGDGAARQDDTRADFSGHEWSEVRQRLDRELDRLGNPAQQLWRLLAQGMSLRGAAVELGISYDTAKRRRRHLLARLRVVVVG
ncbi:MAG TPA: sigma-70 family RNA polymerase sigma factor [Gemmataceae bacterium]|nr:sigma-70 family RNA polymerase sigma factor [Gemmataceae bacterium]